MFGPNVNAILAQGVGHTVPERANDVLTWFGLSNLTPGNPPVTGPTTQPPTTAPPTSAPTTAPPTQTPSGSTAAHWGQCGGIGWTGPTGMLHRQLSSFDVL